MGWSRRDEEFRADYERDYRKHDSLPHRLERKLGTAIEIVLAIRCMNDVERAAELIEQYADSKASEQRLEAVAAGAGA